MQLVPTLGRWGQRYLHRPASRTNIHASMATPELPPVLVPFASGLGAALLAQLARGGAPVAVKDFESARYVWVNEPMAALLGRPAGEMPGLVDEDVAMPAFWPALRPAEQAASLHAHGTVSQHSVEGQTARRAFSVLRVPLESGAEPGRRLLCAIWTELTEANQRQAQLKSALDQLEQEQQANRALRRELHGEASRPLRDPNLRFEDQLRREHDLSSREHREFALVSVQLDPLGDAALAAGDEARERILDALGRQLRDNTRAMDALCRFDDQRFAVLLSGVGLATAHSRMESLRRQCATQIVVHDGRDLGFTVSMGVASFPHTADSQQGLVEAAEAALADARRRGGNRVALASIRFETSAAG